MSFSISTWFPRAPARFGIFALLLAIVVLSLFGGDLTVVRAPGRGSTFTIWPPYAAADSA